MKVKNKHPEFEEWKTKKQFNKEGRKIINEALGIELRPSQMSKDSFIYFSPSNTEEMLPEEFEAFQTEERKANNERAKELRAIHKEERKLIEELIKKREEWNTPFQWINKNRKVKDFSKYQFGMLLNETSEDVSPFAKDYIYYHISNTEEFSSKEEREAELKRLLEELNNK